MVRQTLSTISLYRYRYVLAYVAFAVAMAVMLLVAGFYLPGGLTSEEIRSTLISDNLSLAQLFNLQPEQLIHLPYRLLQAASISFFGISALAIKLPSIILGFASALGMLYLLNLWYKRSVAIIVAMIALTTSQFLLASQAGQAGILYIFLTIMILIAASLIARKNAFAQVWVVVGFVLAAISLYLPLGIYSLLAITLTSIIHPHARHLLLRQASKPTIGIGLVLFLVIISPLVIGIINDTNALITLLGFSDGVSNFAQNASTLATNYVQFMNPRYGAVMAPVYGLGIVLLIGLGLYRLLSTKYTAKSYMISFWLVLLVPLLSINPSYVNISFVPVMLLVALAIDYLISSWYSLFPRNPYARIFGLLPLGVLVVGLVVANIDRYVYGLHYQKSVYSYYNYDLGVLTNELSHLDKSTTVQLIVPARSADFYKSFARHQSYVNQVQVSSDINLIGNAKVTIVERSLKANTTKIPSKILVTHTSNAADRFYLYKN